MKKGFTLIELLAVIAILGLLIGVSVPVYLTISNHINQSMLESKIKELKGKSEKYAEEVRKSVFDVKTLMEAGVLSPDSELGDYKDPVTKRDMSCDIVTVTYNNSGYEASITESDKCYDENYLDSLFGMVEFYLEDENGEIITRDNANTWLKQDKVYVKYRLKSEYENKGVISEVSWSGQSPIRCNTADINSDNCQKYLVDTYENGIKNVEVRLQLTLTLNESGAVFKNNASTKVLLDVQRPTVNEIHINNEIVTTGQRRVDFNISDGFGSGVNGYAFVEEIQENTCQLVTDYKSETEGTHYDYLSAGTYYLCVKDNVGNVVSDDDLKNNGNYRITVENIDSEDPKPSFSINPRNPTGENGWYKETLPTMTITIADTESGVVSANYCITTDTSCTPHLPLILSGFVSDKMRTATVNLREGNVKVCAQAIDVSGRMSKTECSPVYQIDKTLPNITSFSVKDTAWARTNRLEGNAIDVLSGISAYAFTASNTVPNTWNEVKDFPTSSQKLEGTADKNGTWYLYVKDQAGNISNAKSVVVSKVDEVPPAITLNAQTTGGTTGNNWFQSVQVNVTITDSQSGVASAKYCASKNGSCDPNINLNLNGSSGDKSRTSKSSIVLDTNGTNQMVCVQATDVIGRTSEKKCTQAYNIDKIQPGTSFKISGNPNGSNSWYITAPSLTVNGSDSGGSGLYNGFYCISSNGGACTPNINIANILVANIISLANNEGNIRLCAQFTDKAGNKSVNSCSPIYKIDTVRPVLNFKPFSPTLEDCGGTITIDVTNSIDTTSGIASYSYKLDGNTTTLTKGTHDYTSISNTTHTLEVTVTDQAGLSVTSKKYTFQPQTIEIGGKNFSRITSGDGLYCVSHKNLVSGSIKTCSPHDVVTEKGVIKGETGQTYTTNDEGFKKDEYRFGGTNPNNYVRFNGEIWRIIGLVNVKTTSGTVEKRIKIIRKDSIGEFSWDSSASSINQGQGINDWAHSDLYNLLNDYYFNSKNNQSCYSGTNNRTKSCSFGSFGLASVKNYIDQNIIWSTGSVGWCNFDKVSSPWGFYEYERSYRLSNYCFARDMSSNNYCKSGVCCNDVEKNGRDIRQYEVAGAVGIMYPSDYGYATSNHNVCDTSILYTKFVSSEPWWNTCYKTDWLYKAKEGQWTLFGYSDYSSGSAVAMINDGIIEIDYHYKATSSPLNVRPTVYLNSNVKISGGNGTSSNPYTLSV